VYVGEPLTVEARVYTAGIDLPYLHVAAYAGTVSQDQNFLNRNVFSLKPEGPQADGWQTYKGAVEPEEAGHFGFTIMAMPMHPLLPNKFSLGLVRWAE